ncbi:unnamed protein product [Lupinus luteus]|uniref:START domain-containing protein n=1 Tax=Lupinus luteus TaxID=3873 RepID=A0AAV1XHF9_LUPLU
MKIVSFSSGIVDLLKEAMMLIAPIMIGVLVGWAWKPKWANPIKWFSNFFNFLFLSLSPLTPTHSPSYSTATSSGAQVEKDDSNSSLTEQDLAHLCKLVDEKDDGPVWIEMMDRSTPTMSFQAWRRDPENGPPQYRSSTVFEDASPELVRDFFWDDEFRSKWDDMLLHANTIQECPLTGTMIVQWVCKFPFFCSDREYVIGRRIWNSGQAYYCVTKGVPCPSLPRRSKPKRVDIYYSSWCIRAVKSRKDGQLTACEVLLFHYEDMGIPWELAKIGVRRGMWGTVKKLDPGLRLYEKERASGLPLSRSALAANISTKVSEDYLRSLKNTTSNMLESENQEDSPGKPVGRNIPKLLVVGGAIALACTLDHGLLTKAVLFGVARKFAKIGRRL